MSKFKLLVPALVGLAVAVAAPAFAAGGGAEAIKYRQNVMKAIGGHMGAIAAYMKGEVDHAAHVPIHADALMETSRAVADLFPKGSGPEAGETRALGKVWEDPSGFDAAVKAMEAAAEKFAEVAAGTADRKALGAAFAELGKSCGACHNAYRSK